MVLRAFVGKLCVHELAVELTVEALKLARTFRGPGARARGDQLVAAALSIGSNIAEACGRGTVPEFRRFLLYARGSAQETISRSEEHTSELQSRLHLVCRLLLE